MKKLRLKFDSLTSHDITFVGIIQTARASGLDEFPVPYVLTCCHNSLCAVGGTLNEDDHVFGLTAAQKYGGIYVPPHFAVIHQYMREKMAGCGKMILGSDSHTRYGALGTLAIGEGGGELARQLLKRTYDIDYPEIVAVCLEGRPQNGVGPQDVALTLIRAVFENGFVKNRVMEFAGDGIDGLDIDYRNGIDVMTTETTCLSSVWKTDGTVCDYLDAHGRKHDYAKLEPRPVAYYDRAIRINLGKIEPSIALPFHPSNVYTIQDFNTNARDILAPLIKEDPGLAEKIANDRFVADQAIIGGCAGGTWTNICDAANILTQSNTSANIFPLSIYPASQPINLALVKNGIAAKIMEAGGVLKTAFCGPCFGAGDTPFNGGFSVRHTTRNFPNREGSQPGKRQRAYVALMDARSIAATSANGGVLTPATDLNISFARPDYVFDGSLYEKKVFVGWKRANSDALLVQGPGIRDWPKMSELSRDILIQVISIITDAVTTTDELIPSGETASYRSEPVRLADFALARRDPGYVPAAKAVQKMEKDRLSGVLFPERELARVWKQIEESGKYRALDPAATCIGSALYAVKPGDGSAREQAASVQRVLGGLANIAQKYATKRYRSNLINWGILPLQLDADPLSLPFEKGDYLFIPNIRKIIEEERQALTACVVGSRVQEITLTMEPLTEDERKILISGSLINYYRQSD
jgi:aconitate hydratase